MAMKLHEGMKNMSPKAADASTVPKGGRVDDDPVRSTPGKGSPTLGPREA